MDPMALFNGLIDRLLGNLKQWMTAQLFERTEAAIAGLAKFATPVAALLGALIGIILAIKVDSLGMFLVAFAWLFVVILLYYVGSKLQTTCESTIRNNPFSIASQELLDIFVVVTGVFAVLALFAGLYFSVKASSLYPFVLGVTGGFVLAYFAWLLMHPHLVTTYVESSSSAGMDAIAYFSLGNKMFLRTNKLLFGLLPTAAAVLLAQSLFKVFGSPGEVLHGGLQGVMGFLLLILGLLAPLAAYLIFIISYMLLDVMRAILVMGASVSKAGNPQPAAVDAASRDAVDRPTDGVAGVPPAQFEVSGALLKRVGIGFVAVCVLLFGAIKGQEYWAEYQEKRAEQRAAEAERKEQEARQQAQAAAEAARLEAEKQKLAGLVAAARKHVGKPALDLVLETEVNRRLREALRANMSEFENFFSESTPVQELDGLVMGEGCVKGACEMNKAMAVVDTATGEVFAAVLLGGSDVRYLGIEEEKVPAAVKKWVLTHRR